MEKVKLSEAVVPPQETSYSGPCLAAALIVERVLTEKDDAKSLIRLVDKMNVTLEEAASAKEGEIIKASASIFISLRATDDYVGESKVLLILVGPKGEMLPVGIAGIEFKGTRDNLNDVQMPLTWKWFGPGRYRYDVYLDNKLLTQMPFEITVSPTLPEQKAS